MLTMRLSQRNILPVIIIAFSTVIFASVFVGLHAPTSLGDGIRHHTLASRLSQNGVSSFAGWGDILYQGYFSLHNSDPWFLTHILLMPLSVTDIMTAQRIFILMSIVLVSLAMLYAMRPLNLSATTQAVFLALLLFGHVQFSMRLLLGRPLILMVAMSIVIWSTVLQKKAVTAGVLLCIATLLSHLFIFPFFIVLCASIWLWTLREKHDAICMATAGVAGIALGFVLHPQSMEYMHFFFTVFLRIPFLQNLPLGTELKSGVGRMATPFALSGSAILLTYYAVRMCNITKKELQAGGVTLTAFIALVFLFGLCLWVRMLDFLWPILLLLLAQILSLTPNLAVKTAQALLPSFALRHHMPLLILLSILSVHTGKMHHSFRSTDSERLLSHFSVPLQNISADSKILNIDWDLFPALFTVRPDLRYARGMDPSLDFVADPSFMNVLMQIRNSHPENVNWESWAAALEQKYPSDFLVIRIPVHKNVLPYIRAVSRFTEVETSEEIAVFKMSSSSEQSTKDAV